MEVSRFPFPISGKSGNWLEPSSGTALPKRSFWARPGDPVEASLQKTNRLKRHGSWLQVNPI